MSDSTASLRRKIDSAGDLESVVRTMKAMAASNIGQYENAVRALDDYSRTVQLALVACLRQRDMAGAVIGAGQKKAAAICAVVFGSDQGLVGQFNDAMADFVVETLNTLAGEKVVWVVGERIRSRLAETKLVSEDTFVLPSSIAAISTLVGQILTGIETRREKGEIGQVYLFHNAPAAGSVYSPMVQRLLPLDEAWRRAVTSTAWPTKNLPEVIDGTGLAFPAFIREYLFVSLFRACAQSLASENASRLSAMQRAEKNIDELLEEMNRSFHRLRQGGIDEELFDLVSGFEALTNARA